jgi:uncharacterized iron-regulated membrane protein
VHKRSWWGGDLRFWRRWHRWIGFPAALFLLWAASTGVVVAFSEFFGPEEALREATRDLVSPMRTGDSAATWAPPVSRAMSAVTAQAGSLPVDKIEQTFKGAHPTVTIFTGKPQGGEDRKFVVDATSGRIVSVEAYADKPLLYRLHSGEAFGDGGLVGAMFWGTALVFLTVSGLIIYFLMRGRHLEGLRKIFW